MINSDLIVLRKLAATGAVPLALILVLVGCGSSSPSTTPAATGTTGTAPTATTPAPSSGHMTAQQLAAKLAPLGCTPTPANTDTIDLGDIKPVSELECKVKGEEIAIGEYRNAKEVDHNVALAKTLGCALAKELDAESGGVFYYVRGENWYITPDTRSTAEAIKDAIGGDAKVGEIHC